MLIIDEASLTIPKKGSYLSRQVENVEPGLLMRYFKNNYEKYDVKKEIKDMVKFKKLDLFSQMNNGHFDIIFCRNVMIYFNKDMQERLFLRFYDSLNNGGYLIIGKTEGIFGSIRDKFEIINSRERIYQKK